MMNWLGTLLGERRSKERPAAGAAAPGQPKAAASEAEPPDPNAALVAWMLGAGPTRDAPIQPAEQRLLLRLDESLGDGSSAADLLTRMPAGIPQLLSALRDEDLPIHSLREQVSKDLLLTAEVLRLSSSLHYRPRSQAAITDLSQAIAALGRTGLRQAVARVLLRPMFDVQAGTLSSRAAKRLWEHAERKATLAAAMAVARGVDPFEAYLAGLAHNTGWSAAWRVIDRSGLPVALPFSLGFVQEGVWRRDRLFGAVVGAWQITPLLTMLGTQARGAALARVDSPLGPLLIAADLGATAAVLEPEPVAQ